MAQKWWVLTSVACGTFMATLDSSIVNIALPTLTKELGPDLYHVKWVVMIYLLAISCSLLPFGRISDQIGRKPVFQIGFFIFILGSALCGLSPQLVTLVVCRAIQGLGASMLMANGPAIITSTFPAKERGTALGTLAMVVSAGLISGPSIGGFLITYLGWRSIFLVNIPIGIAGIILVQHFVKKDHGNRLFQSFDWLGAVIQIFLLTLLTFIFDPSHIGISRITTIILTVLLAIIFFLIEARAKAPLFDLSLLKNRTFSTANLAGFFVFVSFSSLTVMMPFFLEEVLGFSTKKAGFFMTAIPVTIFIVAPISGRLSDRLGSHGLSFTGALIGAFTLLILAGAFGLGIHKETGHAVIVLALCAMGLATGLFQSPNNSAIMGSVPLHKLSVASALLATIRNLGLVTGTGLATTLFSWRMSVTHDFTYAFHTTLWVAGIFGIAAMLASLGRERILKRKK